MRLTTSGATSKQDPNGITKEEQTQAHHSPPPHLFVAVPEPARRLVNGERGARPDAKVRLRKDERERREAAGSEPRP